MNSYILYTFDKNKNFLQSYVTSVFPNGKWFHQLPTIFEKWETNLYCFRGTDENGSFNLLDLSSEDLKVDWIQHEALVYDLANSKNNINSHYFENLLTSLKESGNESLSEEDLWHQFIIDLPTENFETPYALSQLNSIYNPVAGEIYSLDKSEKGDYTYISTLLYDKSTPVGTQNIWSSGGKNLFYI